MKPSEKNKLIEKFWDGATTRKEEEELFGNPSHEDLTDRDKAYFCFVSQTREKPFDNGEVLWEELAKREKRKKRNFYISTGIAASLLLLVSLFVMTHRSFREDEFSRFLLLNKEDNYLADAGTDNSCNLTLYINGCPSTSDFHTLLQTINPNCIKQINLTNDVETSNTKPAKKGKAEVWLKGESNEIFSVCEGTLYFTQDGEIKSISIDDECGPNLLIDCNEKPLSEILKLKPQQIKTIELTSNPMICSGNLTGEYIVMELRQ